MRSRQLVIDYPDPLQRATAILLATNALFTGV
jgi:hypothetical protein